METLMGTVLRHVEGSEQFLSTLLTTEMSPSALTSLTRNSTSNESLLEVWRKSSIVKQMERILSTTDSAEDDDAFMHVMEERLAQHPHKSLTLVEEQLADDEFALPGKPNFNLFLPEHDETDSIELDTSAVGMSKTTAVPNNHIEAPHKSIPSMTNEISQQPPPNWSHLLDMYFSNTHCWFPICRKHDLLRPAHLLANGDSDQSHSPTAGDRAFLWAVFAYTTHQLDRQENNLDAVNRSGNKLVSSQQLYSIAQTLIPLETVACESGHVRALLVLALFQTSLASWSSAWALVGRAVYIAVDLQIIPPGLQGLAGDFSVSNVRDHKRASMGCFVLDTLVSAHLGRRPYLRHSDLQLVGLPQVDDNEEWETWQPTHQLADHNSSQIMSYKSPGRIVSIYNQFLKLLAVLNDLICLPDQPPAGSHTAKISRSLDAWKESLPSHCQIFSGGENGMKSPKLPQLLNLSVAYASVREVLKVKVGGTTSISTHLEPESSDYLHQLITRVIPLHVQSFGCVCLPPTFEIYLSFCNQSLVLENESLVGKDNSKLQADISSLISEVRAFSTGSRKIQESLSIHMVAENSQHLNPFAAPVIDAVDLAGYIQDSNPQSNSPPPQLSSQPMQSSDFAVLDSLHQSNHQSNQSENQYTFNNISTSLALFTQVAEPAAPAESVTNEIEEDTLFDQLAMLDSDW
jgi:hypothetical protein